MEVKATSISIVKLSNDEMPFYILICNMTSYITSFSALQPHFRVGLNLALSFYPFDLAGFSGSGNLDRGINICKGFVKPIAICLVQYLY